MPVEEYAKRVDAALKGNTQFNVSTVPEAQLLLKRLTQTQKELRQIKKEMTLAMKSLRAQYADQKGEVGRPGVGKGVMQGLFGRKAVGSMNAAQRDQIRQNQNKQLAPYEQLQHKIDQILLEYDSNKLKIESWIAQQKT